MVIKHKEVIGLSDNSNREPMMEMYIFETTQLLEQLEQIILSCEQCSSYGENEVNEIFRIMHTIKGSSAMMLFQNIATLAHSIEDLFYFIREENPENTEYCKLSDLILECIDFTKVEMEKIKNEDQSDGNPSSLIEDIKGFLKDLKQQNPTSDGLEMKSQDSETKQQYYITQKKVDMSSDINIFKAVIYFEEGCEMENIRAYAVINDIKDFCETLRYIPEDIIENDDSIELIRKQGFTIFLKTLKSYEEINEILSETMLLSKLEFVQLETDNEFKEFSSESQIETEVIPKCDSQIKLKEDKNKVSVEQGKGEMQSSTTQSIISVNVNKLDKLMDLVGELVISEAMVTQNSDLKGLELENFHKATRQLRKVTSEVQDMIMSIRMVPLTTTFHKMHRIVRDMSKKLNKEVELKVIGAETEVDKNIIEHISDPLMHLIRNSIDHGIETYDERQTKNKFEPAQVTLEAKNAGGDVLVLVKDNGKGLNKAKILEKAKRNKLLHKSESEMTDREIYNLISLPGFSTKDKVSEFSGRGVGMDVVTKNIEAIGGSVLIDSIPDEGTTIALKIPLTLAIIGGMNIRVGKSRYTIPTTSIKESFRAKEKDIITDPDGNEMIMVRGQCYPILRLHELYKVRTDVTNIPNGIMLMVENEVKTICIFADELIGEQQVVVKALPNYIRNIRKISGVAGCTLLGDGGISLILDISGLIRKEM